MVLQGASDAPALPRVFVSHVEIDEPSTLLAARLYRSLKPFMMPHTAERVDSVRAAISSCHVFIAVLCQKYFDTYSGYRRYQSQLESALAAAARPQQPCLILTVFMEEVDVNAALVPRQLQQLTHRRIDHHGAMEETERSVVDATLAAFKVLQLKPTYQLKWRWDDSPGPIIGLYGENGALNLALAKSAGPDYRSWAYSTSTYSTTVTEGTNLLHEACQLLRCSQANEDRDQMKASFDTRLSASPTLIVLNIISADAMRLVVKPFLDLYTEIPPWHASTRVLLFCGDPATLKNVNCQSVRAVSRMAEGATWSGHGDAATATDTIGRGGIAIGATNFLLDPATPAMALGIYGAWGSGKSSLMKLMEKEMNRGDVIVWFNAWEYLSTQEVWGGMMVEIIQTIEENLGWLGWLWLLFCFNYTKRRRQLIVDLLLPLAAIVTVVVLFVLCGKQILAATNVAKDAATTLPLAASSVGLVFLARQFQSTIKPISQEIKDTLEQFQAWAQHKTRLGYQHQVKKHIKFLNNFLSMQKQHRGWPKQLAVCILYALFGWCCLFLPTSWFLPTTPANGKCGVVVFIDDLDRCQHTKVVEVLEAISLVLCGSGFTVVIGMDKPVVQAAIEDFYKFKDIYLSEAFLQKIVQVEISLSKPRCEEVTTYLESLMPLAGHHDQKQTLPQANIFNQTPATNIVANASSMRARPASTAAVATTAAAVSKATMPQQSELSRPSAKPRSPQPPTTNSEYTSSEKKTIVEVCTSLLADLGASFELRDIKRLVNHHRLARNILIASSPEAAALHWQELVYWVALWWAYPVAMDLLVRAAHCNASELPSCCSLLMAACKKVVNKEEAKDGKEAASSSSNAKSTTDEKDATSKQDDAMKKHAQLALDQLMQLSKQPGEQPNKPSQWLNELPPNVVNLFSCIRLGAEYTRASASILQLYGKSMTITASNNSWKSTPAAPRAQGLAPSMAGNGSNGDHSSINSQHTTDATGGSTHDESPDGAPTSQEAAASGHSAGRQDNQLEKIGIH